MNAVGWLALSGLVPLAMPAAAQDDAKDGSEVVTVTAQRRAQDLQEVPASVTAFTAALREETGIITAQDQLNFTPGVAYSPGADRVTVRGIGRVSQQLGVDAGVAVYQDGFYVGSPTNVNGSTLLLERVEVLRGPQGTLYGRNSIGGAINAISRRPGDEFAFDARTSINSYGGVKVESRVASPIAEGFSMSLTVGAVDQEEGYYKNVSNSNDEGGPEKSWNADVQFQYESEDFDAWLRYTAQDSTTHPRSATSVSRYGINPLTGLPVTDPALIRGTGAPYVFYGLSPDDSPGYRDHRAFRTDRRGTTTLDNYHQVIGELVWHADDFDVKYIGGYRTYDLWVRLDGNATDNTDFDFPFDCALPLFGFNLNNPAYKALNINQIEDCDLSDGQITLVDNPLVPDNPQNPFADDIPVSTDTTPERLTRPVHNDITQDSSDIREEYSHEINITSTGDGPLQYILGAYYFKSNQHQDLDIFAHDEPGNNIYNPNTPGIAPPNPSEDISVIYYWNADLETTSKAVFGQLDYEFSDELKATVGLRYSHDKKIGYEDNLFVAWLVTAFPSFVPGGAPTPFEIIAPSCSPVPLADRGPGGQPLPEGVPDSYRLDPKFKCPVGRTMERSWDAVTGTAGIEWTPNEDRLVYARYSRGYKSGGYNLGPGIAQPFVDSEFVNAYEIGWKETVSDTLQFNSAFFYYDYQNQQVPVTEVQRQGAQDIQVSLLINLPEVETYGAELEVTWEPIENLRLLANYSYLHTEVLDGCCFGDTADPLALQPGAKPVGPEAAGLVPQTLVGNELPGSPHHKVALNATYRWEFDEGELIASATFNWRDDSYYTLFNNPLHLIPGGDSTDLRLSWRDADSGVTIIGTVENVFDQEVSTGFFTDTPARLSFQSLFLEPPRIYTLELQYSF